MPPKSTRKRKTQRGGNAEVLGAAMNLYSKLKASGVLAPKPVWKKLIGLGHKRKRKGKGK